MRREFIFYYGKRTKIYKKNAASKREINMLEILYIVSAYNFTLVIHSWVELFKTKKTKTKRELDYFVPFT